MRGRSNEKLWTAVERGVTKRVARKALAMVDVNGVRMDNVPSYLVGMIYGIALIQLVQDIARPPGPLRNVRV